MTVERNDGPCVVVRVDRINKVIVLGSAVAAVVVRSPPGELGPSRSKGGYYEAKFTRRFILGRAAQ